MGKIKTKLIKRTAETLIKQGIKAKEGFTENKTILGKEMPSKKVRNQIAGYMSRLTKIANEKQAQLDKEVEASAAKK